MKRFILDTEADGLDPTQIWCVCTIDVDTGEEYVWRYDSKGSLTLVSDSIYIGHNILGYDLPSLIRLTDCRIQDRNCIDTLICSRLFNASLDGHALRDWGKRLGVGLTKGDFNEWQAYSDPNLERDRMDRCVSYCLQDCRINLKLFRFLEKHIYSPQWKKALRTEHEAAIICRELHENGFEFDYVRANDLRRQISSMVESIEGDLRKAFPPRSRLVREITPKITKHGTLSKTDFRWIGSGDLGAYSEGSVFSLIEFVNFDPRSPKQTVDILNKARWNPHEKTEGYKNTEKELNDLRRSPKKNRGNLYQSELERLEGRIKYFEEYGWKISEENLATLPEDAPPECRDIVKFRMLDKRLQTLDEWLREYNPDTGKIHGKFTHIGAWTHRMAHSNPNMGNTPSVDSKYHSEELKVLAKDFGSAMRSLFHVPSGYTLVGVDADSIQLRILAHYMNDEEFTNALINGDKSLGTDAHTLNAIALGIGGARRATAKTFIYAWLLGAGAFKVSKILGLSIGEAQDAIQSFINRYPGLKNLKEQVIPTDAKRGFFTGFDGRLIRSDEYHMLAGYLQNGEQCIMKHAAWKWKNDLRRLGIPYWLVNFVHDEWQTKTPTSFSEEVGKIQAEAITWAGEDFGLNCPMLGQAKYGRNWYETH